MRYIPQNRWYAFGYHIVISVVLFISLASVIYFLWYPGFLFKFDGGLEGVQLIAGVDFLIGPFLTLCVYRLGKSSLKFDLTVIALLQAICLAGGMWTIWQTRPVAVVYALGGFKTISYQTFVDYNIAPAQEDLLKGKWPAWIAVAVTRESLPHFKSLSEQLIFQSNLFYDEKKYVSYQSYWTQIKTEGISIENAILKSPEYTAHFQQYDKTFLVYTLGCGSGFGFVIMNPDGHIHDVFIGMERKSAYDPYLMKAKEVLMKVQHSLG